MRPRLLPLVDAVEATDFGPALRKLVETGRAFQIGGVRVAARPLLLALLARSLEAPVLWVTPTLEGAERLYEDASLFLHLLDSEDEAELLAADHNLPPEAVPKAADALGRIPDNVVQVALFPERESSMFDVGASDPERLRVLGCLADGRPLMVIAPVLAVLQKTVAPRVVLDEGIVLAADRDLDLQKLLERLTEQGYERVPMVEHRGQISVRGGIVDIYPSTGEPIRIELFGDTIESLRGLDIDTQRSLAPHAEVTLLPLREHEPTSWLTDHMPDSAYVILEEPARLKLRTDEWASEEGGSTHTGLTWEAVESFLGKRPRIELTSWGATESSADVYLETEPAEQFASRLEDFTKHAVERAGQGRSMVVVTHQSARLRDIFEREQDVTPIDGLPGPPQAGRIHVVNGHLSEGFVLQPGLEIITDRELLGTSRRRRYFRTAERGSLLKLEDLKPGDVIVHSLHGIGRFEGVATLDLQGGTRDFLKVTYARGDNLFVPVDQMEHVSKYVGMDTASPTLSRLGRGEWQKTRQRVSEEVREMAEKLLRLHAERKAGQGHPFQPDTVWQEELEAAFPFEETRDQARAIDAVKTDMEQPSPMDRLVCGDVGYGKTEVAVRAAFKAVMDGRQVAVLVPTTVLAQQHFQTFRERLGPFPVRVEVMSRFRSAKEQREVAEGIKDGSVDVVVGTHRLLGKDIQFKSLGLIVVDEEQHFGVAHKERLKELKATVDVLTMTATPIPRTMQMALMGMRDLSLIETPPMHRLPIKTYLFEAHPEVVKGAIMRELDRDGQIFFVHNRVHGIEKVAADIRKLVPAARVVVGHGQMPEDRLEQVMLEFVEGEHDVLVCTTIIESGLDIPTVNTIIINNAHMFGLGQLYQLRGRVGRGHHQAYCYLLYPPHRSLTAEAEQRLDTIREFTALGSGFQIAMRDLEIRGAGNLLGGDQSGHIASVGFDLYCHMLEDAVAELQGKQKPHGDGQGPIIDLPVEAFLPDDYIQDARQKITLYRRLAEIREEGQVEDMRNELRDRFGPLPQEVEHLVTMVRLKARCLEVGVPSIKFRKSVVERAILCVLPFVTSLTRRQLDRVGELTGTHADFEQHVLTLTELPQAADWGELVLKALTWVRDHTGSAP